MQEITAIVDHAAAIRSAVREYQHTLAAQRATLAECQAFSAAHPGPDEPGGSRENLELVCAFEAGPLQDAVHVCGIARNYLDDLIRSAGARGVFVGGRLYLSLSDEEHQEDEHLGMDRGLILDLDAIGGGR